jgi:predicted nucleotidyltransferase/GNAT superfamily N-acetyltransferase/5'(3')-deoxyribonucleotidase
MRAAEIINPMRLQEVTQHRPHLYLDMDGVQADFFSAWARLFGKERYKEIGDRAQREATIADLNARGPEFVEQFFRNLPVLSGAQTLIKFLRDNDIKYTILSAPLRGNEEASIRGKLAWLDRHHPGTSATAIFTGEKQRYATSNGNPNVLVDDFKKYVNAWNANNGIAVLYRWNNVGAAIEQLKKIYGLEPDARVNNLNDLQEAVLGTLYPKKILGTARVGDLSIPIHRHLYDQAQSRGIDLKTIERTLRRLPRIASKLKKIEPGNKVWVYNPHDEISLGFFALDSGGYLLNTVIPKAPHQQGVTAVIRMYENLTELWTQPYELTSRVIGPASLEYYFDTKDNRSGRIVFDSSLDSDQGGTHVVLVIVHFYIDNLYHTSGKGDAVAIFSTVVAACRDYLRRYRPPVVTFETPDAKKRNLYVKMSGMFPDYVVYPYLQWVHDPIVGDEIVDSLMDDNANDAVVLRRRDYDPKKTRVYVDEQGVAEGSPNFNREWDEATRYPEFVNLGKKKWIELVSKGKPVTVTRKNVNKINNTDAADPNSFKLLDPEKQKRALAQLSNGDVEMPIVARYSDGYLELIGGNTRLTAQMAKDGQAKVWLFNVPAELTQGVSEATGDEKFDTMMSRMAAEPKVADMHSNMPPTSIPELLQWANKNNKPYHRKFAEWARNNNFTNVNAALEWFGDNVDPWDEFGSKEHENVFGDLVGEPLIDAAKHDPKAAELLKVYVSYEKIFDDWTDKYRQMNYPDRFGNFNEQGVAEGQDDNGISFQVQKGKNKFATTLSIGNKPVGVYQYDADTGRSIAEVYPEFKGKGLGKLLVLHAIYTAAQLGLDFQEDESRTAEYDNVLDSLSSNGYIVDDDGYWYVTGEGEQYLQQSMKQGVAEGKHQNQQVVNAIQKVLPVAQEIWFHGSRATGQHRRNSDTDILVVVPDELVGDQYLGVVRILQKLSSHFDNYDIQPTKSGTNIHQIAQEEGKLLWSTTNENFADGKVKGKSRPGRVKRAGASCNGSVTDLRQRAKNASGEKAKMYHWCANMKSGKKK